MEKFELVLEILESGSDSIKTLGLLNCGVTIVDSKVLDEHEAGPVIFADDVVVELLLVGFSEGFDGVKEVSSRNRVNGVAELIV